MSPPLPAAPSTPQQGIAWVTGASSGLGRQLVLDLVKQGWTVAASARRVVDLEQLSTETNGRAIACPVDITDAVAVAELVQSLEQKGHKIVLAVLNAGTYRPDSALNFDLAAFEETQHINVNGTAHCLAAILPAIIARKQGQIAIVSSVAGYRGLPRSIAYSASKAALIAMTEAMAFDLTPIGIKIQLVCPGFVKTPLTDKNDFAMPCLMPVDQASAKLVAGLQGRAFQITFPRRFTLVMQGLRLIPWSIFYALLSKTIKGTKND